MPQPRTVSLRQMDQLLRFMETYRNVAMGSKGGMVDGHLRQSQLVQAWQKIAQVLNRMGGGNKTGNQWRTYWTELKYRAKKNAREREIRPGANASAPPPMKRVKRLSDTDARIVGLLKPVPHQKHPYDEPLNVDSDDDSPVLVKELHVPAGDSLRGDETDSGDEPAEGPGNTQGSGDVEWLESGDTIEEHVITQAETEQFINSTDASDPNVQVYNLVRDAQTKAPAGRGRQTEQHLPSAAARATRPHRGISAEPILRARRQYAERRLKIEERKLRIEERRLQIKERRLQVEEQRAQSQARIADALEAFLPLL